MQEIPKSRLHQVLRALHRPPLLLPSSQIPPGHMAKNRASDCRWRPLRQVKKDDGQKRTLYRFHIETKRSRWKLLPNSPLQFLFMHRLAITAGSRTTPVQRDEFSPQGLNTKYNVEKVPRIINKPRLYAVTSGVPGVCPKVASMSLNAKMSSTS